MPQKLETLLERSAVYCTWAVLAVVPPFSVLFRFYARPSWHAVGFTAVSIRSSELRPSPPLIVIKKEAPAMCLEGAWASGGQALCIVCTVRSGTGRDVGQTGAAGSQAGRRCATFLSWQRGSVDVKKKTNITLHTSAHTWFRVSGNTFCPYFHHCVLLCLTVIEYSLFNAVCFFYIVIHASAETLGRNGACSSARTFLLSALLYSILLVWYKRDLYWSVWRGVWSSIFLLWLFGIVMACNVFWFAILSWNPKTGPKMIK